MVYQNICLSSGFHTFTVRNLMCAHIDETKKKLVTGQANTSKAYGCKQTPQVSTVNPSLERKLQDEPNYTPLTTMI